MLIHLDPDDLAPPTRLDWAPEGFVAYSAICTHLGCTVNFSHDPMEGAPYPHIHCPCHAGLFNPQAGAKVVGGPPPRPLPQLPLALNVKGELVAAGPFEEPVGVLGG
jgi:rieske iron-sulfur protein